LGGREFKRVKNGLDEAQVASCINELIKERDKLAQSQDHIASLNRLAKRTIVEADKLATQIKTEATEQTKAASAAIIDKAKEQARQMSEKKIAEAAEIANEKANAIKAKAEEEAALLIENEKNKIRNELRNLVNQQFGYMLEELEHLKQQAAAVQADFGNKLSEPREEKSTVTVKIAGEGDAAAVGIAKESETIVAEIAEERDAAAREIAKESKKTLTSTRSQAGLRTTPKKVPNSRNYFRLKSSQSWTSRNGKWKSCLRLR
jgi:DNA-binding protein YbaB